jgi:uncharacterized protein
LNDQAAPSDRDPTEPHPAERDRDAAGRARSARPRDAAGRPLPYGTPGVARIPDDLALPPRRALDEAQQLIDTNMPFHAHEVLEAAWKAAPASERDLWQGLAQVAVGLTHAQRGNAVGASALLRRGAQRLAAYTEAAPYGVDVAGLADWARTLADRIERDGLAALAPDQLRPRL